MPKHITQQEKEKIVTFYKSKPMTIETVSNHFNISQPSVIKILNCYHIKRYPKVKLFSPDLNEKYFDKIDTEYKAYFLGLIITDGCIHNTKGKQHITSIALQDKDSYILYEFKKEICSNKNITHDGRGCSKLQILSDRMANSLKRYDVIERKSLNIVFPQNVPIGLYPHLLRGIFDGDGSISYYNRPHRKSHVKAVRLCQGNEKFLIDIINFLYKQCGIVPIHTYREKENLWSFAYRKDTSIIKLIDYLYGNAHIFIKRKKHLCDLVYAECKQYIDGNTEITNKNNNLFVS